MPHVIVKCWPGKTDVQKHQLAEAITRSMVEIMGAGPNSISVSVEEVAQENWKAEVYDPDIKARWEQLYKLPGYEM